MQWQAIDWKRIFTNHESVKGLVYQIYIKKFAKLSKKTTQRKWAKCLNRRCTKEDIQMAKYMIMCPISLVIRKMESQTTMSYPYLPTGKSKIRMIYCARCRFTILTGTSHTAGRDAKWYNHFGNYLVNFLKRSRNIYRMIYPLNS